jgi:hypothetical protein
MATRNVTVSLDEATYRLLKSAAESQHQSLSAVLARAARQVAMREAGRRYDEWVASDPEMSGVLDDWDRPPRLLRTGITWRGAVTRSREQRRDLRLQGSAIGRGAPRRRALVGPA